MSNEKDTLQQEENKINEKSASPQEELQEDAPVEENFAEVNAESKEEAEEKPENDQESTREEDELKKVEAKLKETEEKLEYMENRYLRLQADFENYKRRKQKDFEAAMKYRAQDLITDILPILDNFERALKFKPEHEETKSHMQGMEMIYKSLVEALKKEGVKEIEAVGKEFDPHFHQAVMQANEEGYGSNIVVEEFQKGYLLKDRIIRPAMVKVNQ